MTEGPPRHNPVTLAGMLDTADSSLLEVVDSLLDRGVVLDGELVLGLADVDLVYLRLSLVLVAADRVLPRRS
jgi:hypothetical protein